MKEAEKFARAITGELAEEAEKTLKPYNVKFDLTQTMHVEALVKKTGSSRAEIIRKLVDVGIQETWNYMDEETKAEMNVLCRQVAIERARELEGEV